jgi:hypothetical protein
LTKTDFKIIRRNALAEQSLDGPAVLSWTFKKCFSMATDMIKWHIDNILEAARSGDNPHLRLGRISFSAEELLKFYETGTLIHHKKGSTMTKKDELKHISDPGEVKEETKQEPAAEVAQAPETGEASAAE